MTEAEKIKAQIAELEKKLEAVDAGYWVPENRQKYHYVANDGDVDCSSWYGDAFDLGCLEIGNVFKTEEEAEHALKVRKAYTRFKRMAKGWKFTPGRTNYGATYKHHVGIWNIYFYEDVEEVGQIYFENKQDCEAAIAAMGDDMDLLREVV